MYMTHLWAVLNFHTVLEEIPVAHFKKYIKQSGSELHVLQVLAYRR